MTESGGNTMRCKDCTSYRRKEKIYKIGCENCSFCVKGLSKSQPDKYICIGSSEPHIIDRIKSGCLCSNYLSKITITFDFWSWNEIDNDSWSHGEFNTRKDAIADAIKFMKCRKDLNPEIYLGKCKYVPFRTDIDAERVLAYLDEAYCSDTGCEDYIYDDVTDDQIEWLENKLSDIMVEFHERIGLKPTYFEVIGYPEKINLKDIKCVR